MANFRSRLRVDAEHDSDLFWIQRDSVRAFMASRHGGKVSTYQLKHVAGQMVAAGGKRVDVDAVPIGILWSEMLSAFAEAAAAFVRLHGPSVPSPFVHFETGLRDGFVRYLNECDNEDPYVSLQTWERVCRLQRWPRALVSFTVKEPAINGQDVYREMMDFTEATPDHWARTVRWSGWREVLDPSQRITLRMYLTAYQNWIATGPAVPSLGPSATNDVFGPLRNFPEDYLTGKRAKVGAWMEAGVARHVAEAALLFPEDTRTLWGRSTNLPTWSEDDFVGALILLAESAPEEEASALATLLPYDGTMARALVGIEDYAEHRHMEIARAVGWMAVKSAWDVVGEEVATTRPHIVNMKQYRTLARDPSTQQDAMAALLIAFIEFDSVSVPVPAAVVAPPPPPPSAGIFGGSFFGGSAPALAPGPVQPPATPAQTEQRERVARVFARVGLTWTAPTVSGMVDSLRNGHGTFTETNAEVVVEALGGVATVEGQYVAFLIEFAGLSAAAAARFNPSHGEIDALMQRVWIKRSVLLTSAYLKRARSSNANVGVYVSALEPKPAAPLGIIVSHPQDYIRFLTYGVRPNGPSLARGPVFKDGGETIGSWRWNGGEEAKWKEKRDWKAIASANRHLSRQLYETVLEFAKASAEMAARDLSRSFAQIPPPNPPALQPSASSVVRNPTRAEVGAAAAITRSIPDSLAQKAEVERRRAELMRQYEAETEVAQNAAACVDTFWTAYAGWKKTAAAVVHAAKVQAALARAQTVRGQKWARAEEDARAKAEALKASYFSDLIAHFSPPPLPPLPALLRPSGPSGPSGPVSKKIRIDPDIYPVNEPEDIVPPRPQEETFVDPRNAPTEDCSYEWGTSDLGEAVVVPIREAAETAGAIVAVPIREAAETAGAIVAAPIREAAETAGAIVAAVASAVELVAEAAAVTLAAEVEVTAPKPQRTGTVVMMPSCRVESFAHPLPPGAEQPIFTFAIGLSAKKMAGAHRFAAAHFLPDLTSETLDTYKRTPIVLVESCKTVKLLLDLCIDKPLREFNDEIDAAVAERRRHSLKLCDAVDIDGPPLEEVPLEEVPPLPEKKKKGKKKG
jgi:hypothetical protein